MSMFVPDCPQCGDEGQIFIPNNPKGQGYVPCPYCGGKKKGTNPPAESFLDKVAREVSEKFFGDKKK